MAKVLKIRYSNGSGFKGYCFVQKVTQSIICIIKDESTIEYFLRSNGCSCSRMGKLNTQRSVIVDFERVNELMTKSCLTTWDGHWKPKYNARNELVYPYMSNLSDFNYSFEKWFAKQSVEIIDITDSVKVHKQRIPHPFEVNGIVYNGNAKIKVRPDDTEESVRKRLAEETARVKQQAELQALRYRRQQALSEIPNHKS